MCLLALLLRFQEAGPFRPALVANPTRRRGREGTGTEHWVPALVPTSLWPLDLTYITLLLSVSVWRPKDVRCLKFIVASCRHCLKALQVFTDFTPVTTLEHGGLYDDPLFDEKEETN